MLIFPLPNSKGWLALHSRSISDTRIQWVAARLIRKASLLTATSRQVNSSQLITSQTLTRLENINELWLSLSNQLIFASSKSASKTVKSTKDKTSSKTCTCRVLLMSSQAILICHRVWRRVCHKACNSNQCSRTLSLLTSSCRRRLPWLKMSSKAFFRATDIIRTTDQVSKSAMLKLSFCSHFQATFCLTLLGTMAAVLLCKWCRLLLSPKAPLITAPKDSLLVQMQVASCKTMGVA